MDWRSSIPAPHILWVTRRLGTSRSASVSAALFGVLAVVAFAAVALLATAVPPAGAQVGGESGPIEPGELLPDVTLLLVDGTIEDPEVVAGRLGEIDGLARAVVEPVGDNDPLVHLALADGGGRARPLEAVVAEATEVVTEVVPGVTEVVVGGSSMVDRTLGDRFGRSAAWLAVLAAALGLAAVPIFGLRRGLAAGLAVGLAVLAARSIGAQAAGPFDGTAAATALPAALAGLVVAVTLAYRLLVWFRRPAARADVSRIEEAARDLAPELLVVAAGLGIAALVVEPLDPGRSVVTVVAVGAAVAALTVLAVLAPALTLLEDDRPGPRADVLPVTMADGRDLPLPVVGLATLALVVVSTAALGQVGGALLGVEQLDPDDGPARVASTQARLGGDPTQGVVAVASDANLEDLAGWAALVAERSDVAWVDVGSSRQTAAGPVEVDPSALLTTPALSDAAVIVPSVAARSVEGQALVERIAELPLAGGPPTFLGAPAAGGGPTGSRTTVLVTVAVLALVSGAAALALTGNRALAVLAAGLRLLGGGATVGLYNLVVGDPELAPALIVLSSVGLGALLAEVELIRRLDDGSLPEPLPVDRDRPSTWPSPGQFGALGVAALVPAGIVLAAVGPLGGGPGTVSLGLVLVLTAIVEILAGAAVLRPALLGQRPAYQTAARPLRVALHARSTGDPQADTPPDDDPQWREIVIDLIQTEFSLQTEPETAELDLVFEADTPVHRQAAARRADLVASGLRVVGRSPELRSLRTVRDRLPTIVTVTVDHPESQLLARDGTVVGIRRPERRVGRLWLTIGPDGGHRIAESIELGTTPLTESDHA